MRRFPPVMDDTLGAEWNPDRPSPIADSPGPPAPGRLSLDNRPSTRIPLDNSLNIGGSLSLDALGEVGAVAPGDDFSGLGAAAANLRFSWDLSSRTLYNDRTGQPFHATFIGMDLHKVFTGPGGDWGVAVLQPYLTRLDNFAAQPPFFDDGDDWELVWRIFNFNYILDPKGALNVRFGHLEIPFGLEQVINTNGTLLDYIHGANFGLKADWGVTLNGVLPDFEYEFALTRGSGNEWINRGDPYIISGRIGTPREDAVSFGMSVLYGNVFRYATPDTPVRRWRGGLDVIFGAGPFEVRGEVAVGENDGADIVTTVTELDWTSPYKPLTVYNQVFTLNSDVTTSWDHNVINNLGFRWTPNNHWAISGQYSQNISTFGMAPRQGIFAIQFRYRT